MLKSKFDDIRYRTLVKQMVKKCSNEQLLYLIGSCRVEFNKRNKKVNQ